MNEIAAVVTSYPAEPQPRKWAWNNPSGKKTLLSFTPVRHCQALSFDPSSKHVPRSLTCVYLVNGMDMSLNPSAKASNVCAMSFSNLVGRVSKSVSRSSTRGKTCFRAGKVNAWFCRLVCLETRPKVSNICTSVWVHFNCKHTESECLDVSSVIVRACVIKNTHTRRSEKRKRHERNEGVRETDIPRFSTKLLTQ